jgi:hypothetical protein
MVYQPGVIQESALTGTEIVFVDNGAAQTTGVPASKFWLLPSGTSAAAPGALFYESAASGLTAHAGGGQANALQLVNELNRVSTVATIGDSVALPASAPGLTIILENAGANPMQVYGLGTDTINGVASGTGVSQMAGSVVIYTCYAAGSWFANGLGTGYAGSLETSSTTTSITAFAAGGQASATALSSMINNVTTVGAANASVKLPANAVGMTITVINNGGSNSMNVYPDVGSTMNGTLNGAQAVTTGTVTIFYCVAVNTWVSK